MYDFYGFEQKLYEYKFDINSDEKLTYNLIEKLRNQNINVQIDTQRKSYDHGVWTALSMMYETLDIPVLQLSLPINYSAQKLITLGECLKTFKSEAMIVCSGSITHNLSDMSMSNSEKDYVKIFNNKILDILKNADEKKLLEIQNDILFYKNHPTNEHFLPLYIAFGSAYNKKGKSFNSEFQYSSLSMECFIFDK